MARSTKASGICILCGKPVSLDRGQWSTIGAVCAERVRIAHGWSYTQLDLFVKTATQKQWSDAIATTRADVKSTTINRRHYLLLLQRRHLANLRENQAAYHQTIFIATHSSIRHPDHHLSPDESCALAA